MKIILKLEEEISWVFMSKNLISVEKISKAFAEKIICKEQSFGIHENDKIGLVGINGSGKTTILKMIIGIEPVDEGKIVQRNKLRISYLPQTPELDPKLSIYEQLYFSENNEFRLLRRYYNLLKEIENTDNQEFHSKLENVSQEIDACNGWEIETKAKSYLTKLKLYDWDRNISQLSGGEKRKLDLARVLMEEADVLILDEPTNHLDIDSIEWLQKFLQNFKGVLIYVTHDRYFLDAVSNKIMEITESKIIFYQGNYSFYLKKKELEQIDLQRKETRLKSQLKKELKWLARGARARTSKPKNHLDRVQELISKSYHSDQAELDISFQSKKLGKTILELKNISKSYSNNKLISNFSHIFQKKERIGIIGANGCGKTTLLKIITAEIEADAGTVNKGINTHFSYFTQDQTEFSKDISVINYIRQFAENIHSNDGNLHSASEMLQRFLFDGKMQQSKISSLSGGEKKRLYLLRSLMFGSNFIIMDEPTNDLDIKTLEILEEYLDAFKECLLVVSHDRFFLDRTVDYLFVFEKNGIRKFPGNYSDYLLVKRYREEEEKENIKQKKNDLKLVKDKSKQITKKLSFKQKRELEKIELELKKIENYKSKLETKIETEAATLDSGDFRNISKELGKISEKIEELENRWLEIKELID